MLSLNRYLYIMYQSIGIAKLSENQLSRLRNGHPVRVKLGSHHKIHLSIQQLKKLNSASKKGKASTITFDPYQMEGHGCGKYGDIATKTKKGCGAIKTVLSEMADVADVVGLGICRKHVASAKKPRKSKKGKGFLSDLTNIAKVGAMDIAQKGIDAGASYISDKIAVPTSATVPVGSGVIHKGKRIVGRRVIGKKKPHGGSGSGCCGSALFPSGFSGAALMPA